MTLRITLASINETQTALRLEGRFTAPDLPVLESCLEQLGEVELMLDLAELRWLDRPAAARLVALIGEGARVLATSPFVEQLLVGGGGEVAPEDRLSGHETDSPVR